MKQLTFYDNVWGGPMTFNEFNSKYNTERLEFEWTSIIGPRSFGTALWRDGNWNATVTTADIKATLKGDPIATGNLSTAKVWFKGE